MKQMDDSSSVSAHDDWDRHWEEYAETVQRNPAQAYRRKVIFSLLGSVGDGSGMRLLDIGSGQGDLAAEVRKRFPAVEILGLELSQSGIAISQAKVRDARFVQRNLLEPGDPPRDQQSWATHAVCSEVIEHVDRPGELLRRAQAYMAPGCTLIVTAPGGPMSAFDKHIGHRTHFGPAAIRALLAEAGYETEQVAAAGFPFFNLYRLAVLLRGKRLVSDVRDERPKPRLSVTSILMWAFDLLFQANLTSTPWGWQMLAVARAPGRQP